MRCDFCGYVNLAGVRYCRRCASSIDLLCPECGLACEADSPYCEACGACVGVSP